MKSHGVRFVVIGGFAGRLWGSTLIIDRLEICYARDRKNYRALAAALPELDACLLDGPESTAVLNPEALESGDRFTFETDAGTLVCVGTPTGSGGFLDLIQGATRMVLDSGPVPVAALEDVIRLKRANGMADDLVEVEILAALREEIERSKREARA